MRDDTAIVHHNEGSAFGLTFPDLPGCFAAADSWDEISAAAAEALDLWFEDMPSGQPASLSEIRARPEVSRKRKAGADLLPVPDIPADTAVQRVNIPIERGLLQAIDQTAKARGMNRSSFLASANRRELVGAS
ncbi:type II toxin-antitoxin system HicB family antitoxin [Pararhodobacter zhoushanensis]|uniref:type II toxin-antitoxin system HicB family antitoxin n=1 Tax=Pararhodobacter zhoushanensis TaxID=2479545 RepID=UPI000F8F5DF0|nr:type II toxin-antitoxin system HicB family antitoxin [Pararhodobacter zhoushanensis]